MAEKGLFFHIFVSVALWNLEIDVLPHISPFQWYCKPKFRIRTKYDWSAFHALYCTGTGYAKIALLQHLFAANHNSACENYK